MASTLNKTLPGFGPIEKTRFTFTDTLLADVADTLTVAEMLHGLLSMTPTATRILTLPAAAVLEASSITLAGLQVADAIPFILRNQAAPGSGFNVVLAAGAGGAVDSEANLTVPPNTHSEYMLRIDDANPTSPNYTVFQIDSGSADPGAAYLTAESPGGAAATGAITPGTPLIIPTTVFGVDANAVNITNNATTFTVTNAGVYKVDVSWTTASNVVDSTALMHIAVGGVINLQALGGAFIGLAAGGVTASGAGSLILSLAAGAVLTLFFDAVSAGTPIFTASNLTVNIVRLA